MKTIIASVSALLLLAGAYAFTHAVPTWKIDASAAKVSFEMPNEGTKGTLGNLEATIQFDMAHLTESVITATVDAATINTGIEGKDKHLKTNDFFDAEKFPKIKFVSQSIKATDKGFETTGKLTIKDSTHVITIPFTFEKKGEEEGVFKGTMDIFSGDYGVMKKSKSGKDQVVVTLEVPVKKL